MKGLTIPWQIYKLQKEELKVYKPIQTSAQASLKQILRTLNKETNY